MWKEAVETSFMIRAIIILQGLRCVMLCSSIVLIITCGTLLAIACFGSNMRGVILDRNVRVVKERVLMN